MPAFLIPSLIFGYKKIIDMQNQHRTRNMTPKSHYNRKLTLQRPFSNVKKEALRISSRTLTRKKSDIQQEMLRAKTSQFNRLGLSSTSWYLYDAKNQKELGFRYLYQRQIASLTKIMTTIIAIELCEQFNIREDLMVKVTTQSCQLIGTTANLIQNTWVYVQDLLYGAMLPSGNDAAYLLSQVFGFFLFSHKRNQENAKYMKTIEKLDFSEQTNTNIYSTEFIKKMNLMCRKLKMGNTCFSNPHGLANGMNVSCARDMVLLSHYASRNKKFRKVMNTQYKWYYEFADEYKQKRRMKKWWNTNQLLKKGWEGVKTGQTLPAGNCLSSLKNEIFIVVLNCNTMQSRFTETEKIYNWYVENNRSQFSTFQSSDQL